VWIFHRGFACICAFYRIFTVLYRWGAPQWRESTIAAAGVPRIEGNSQRHTLVLPVGADPVQSPQPNWCLWRSQTFFIASTAIRIYTYTHTHFNYLQHLNWLGLPIIVRLRVLQTFFKDTPTHKNLHEGKAAGSEFARTQSAVKQLRKNRRRTKEECAHMGTN